MSPCSAGPSHASSFLSCCRSRPPRFGRSSQATCCFPQGCNVDIAMVPSIDKTSVAALSTLLLCWMKGIRHGRRIIPVGVSAWGLYSCCPIFTSFGNSYELETAGRSIPGFLPARRIQACSSPPPDHSGALLCRAKDSSAPARRARCLLRAIVVAALVYSLPMLVEIRISP